ncbi:ATP dependent RNA helicase [Grosmannia clavigera kw1407]|uniref:ATP-dependent RNA helicase n=1 Tax=Grosmannia clavigera (strain kw1407 / UAMH 11150) TaxID=655863 RepID=F0XSY2_GROCL|nr:ATP dependent RNA helicase [Grosmannia clavigera kw1407]EFW99290.1 ATP dependent RNA helicase [Grosmannia clavigera kw1407]
MADDGMLLNFDLGDVAVSKQVKFKGGKWRDRNRAQRSAKRQQEEEHGGLAAESSSNSKDRPLKRRRVDGSGTAEAGGDGASVGEPNPNAARNWKPHGANIGRPATGRREPQNGVTSRLFTSNPTAVTDFGSAQAAAASEADGEPVKPSNAPLSDDASTFLALGLSRRIAQHLSTKLGLKAPTAIQHSAVPQLVTQDNDAFLQAETGSGKTLAYLLPLMQRILALSENEDGSKRKDGRAPLKIHRDSGLFAIILAPTRELCKQISVVLEKLLRCAPWIVSTTVIGGESKKSEKARIRKGVNILIATPGRLTDHLDNTEVLDVGTVRWLVLDEGDRLMEMGFEEDIRTIVGKIRKHGLKDTSKDGLVLPKGVLPSRRVTVLCSATMKMNVQKLGEISLEDAIHVQAGTAADDAAAAASSGGAIVAATESAFSAPAQLKQMYIVVPAKLRLVTLIGLLRSTFARKGSVMKAIIFISKAPAMVAPKASPHTVNTVGPAAYITSPANRTVVLHKLHGSLAQPVRTATLAAFSQEKNPAVLVTTDIASRGLDVPAVDLVIEYDPAFAVDDHLHRIGRTARAGRPGKAVLFLQPGGEEGYVSLLQSSSASTLVPQLYDTVLQAGFATTVDVPKALLAAGGDERTSDGTYFHDPSKSQSWSKRAESLQLHIEQRLLQTTGDEQDGLSPSSSSSPWKHSKMGGKGKSKFKEMSKDSKILEEARQAFRSHIRAYATHVRDERVYFDITQLHLGHTAKSFGLREAPGGIGGGVQRRTKRPSSGPAYAKNKTLSSRGTASRGDDDDDKAGGAADEEAAKRMRMKMQAVMTVPNRPAPQSRSRPNELIDEADDEQEAEAKPAGAYASAEASTTEWKVMGPPARWL